MPPHFEELSKHDLSQALCDKIIPPVKREAAPLVLAPLTILQSGTITTSSFTPDCMAVLGGSSSVGIEAMETPLLRATQQGRNFHTMSHWVKEGLNAVRYPSLIYVLDGAAHFRIGITRRMAENAKTLNRKFGAYLVMLPEGSFLALPPGVPFSDASRPHWEGENLEQAYSRLVWFHIQPDGIALHSCSTHDGQHAASPTLFVNDARFLPLAESFLAELQNQERHAVALAYSNLLTIMLHVERGLSARLPMEERFTHKPSLENGSSTSMKSNSPVQRARQYIETHLGERLTLENIASHSYISGSYLNRLFRAEVGMTAAEYVTQRRLERAQQLLKDTDLPVRRVGALVGYPHPEHFNRLFSKRFGVSPGAFRRPREKKTSHDVAAE